MLCFQHNTLSDDDSRRQFKARVEVCEAAGLSPGATEAAGNIVAEEDNIKTSSLTVDKLKEYLKNGAIQWRATLHLSGINNKSYVALNQSVKNTWLTQQVNAVPKSYTETVKLAEQFVEPNTRKRVSTSMKPGMAFMQTG